MVSVPPLSRPSYRPATDGMEGKESGHATGPEPAVGSVEVAVAEPGTAQAPPQGRWRPRSKEQLSQWRGHGPSGRDWAPAGTGAPRASQAVRAQLLQPDSLIPSPAPAGPARRRRSRATGPVKGRAGPNAAAAAPNRGPRLPARAATPSTAPLNGFALLEAASADLPENVTRANVSSGHYASVAEADLGFFQSLRVLEAGENELRLHQLCALAALEELRLQCNGIRVLEELPRGAFPRLEVLDLSFNAVEPDSLTALAALPRLRELDLTGNELSSLPRDMGALERLEDLRLDDNRLEDEGAVLALAALTQLRRLSLARNYLGGVPADIAARGERGGFPRLERLSLADNYVSLEADLLGLALLPRLTRVVVHGNPVVDSAIVRARAEAQEEKAPADPMVSVLAAQGRRGRRGGRRHPDSVVATLFPELADAMAEASAAAARFPPAVVCFPPGTDAAPAKKAYASFPVARVTAPPVPLTADWRAAGNAALHRQYPMLQSDRLADAQPPPRSPREEEEEGKDGASPAKPDRGRGPKAREARDQYTGEGIFLTGDGAEVEEAEEEEESDDESVDSDTAAQQLLQEALARRDLSQPAPPNPAKLRAAVNALRFTLRHSMTSTSSEQRPARFQQPTIAQQTRQKPRRPYVPKKLSEKGAAQRHRQAQTTMANVQDVLDAMGARYAQRAGQGLGASGSGGAGEAGGGGGGDDAGMGGDGSMASLLQMVNRVMDEYEGFDDPQ